MTRPPQTVYPSSGRYELAIFDLRLPGIAERLHRERAAWQGQSEIEVIDQDHTVLVIRPGGAQRLAR